MIEKDIEQIYESDLKSLVDNEVPEGKTIEYKQSLPTNQREDKIEFLADVSSFANASGGNLIIGIKEENGIAKEVIGITIDYLDEEKLRLENIIRDGISSRIPLTTIKPIELSNSKTVMLIRISQSWISPHRVTFSGHDKFYSRNSAGKYPLDVDELRIAFNLSETTKEKIKNFMLDRVAKIHSNDTSVPLQEGTKVILHLIPLISFSRPQQYAIKKVTSNPQYRNMMRTISGSLQNERYNFDGYQSFSGRESIRSFVQLYRNGIIESVDGLLIRRFNSNLSIRSVTFEEKIVESLSRYLDVLKLLEVSPPIFVFITLIDVKGFKMSVGTGYEIDHEDLQPIDRDVLFLPETILEDLELDIPHLLKPAFDAVWNACGLEKSLNYNENGDWNPSRQ